MQTHEWEALLEGTTPAPWRWYWDYGIIALEGADTMPVATDLHVHDSDLLAVAPEAVAEVIRLRRAITDLRDDYLAHIATREFFVDQVSGLVVEIREDVDDYYGTAADDLTRILEGDNHA